MAEKRILILDDCQEPVIIGKHSWSDFVDENDKDVELFILTSTGALSEKDKSSPHVRVYKEIDRPTSDGTLELWSFKMHKKYSFTHVYTKFEDLMIRAAHLRTLFNLKTGLSAEQIPAYREKVRMKEIAAQGGFPVPPFARLFAPADLIGFIEKNGYPVVVKPTLGCGTSGLHLVSNADELQTFLSSKIFSSIDLDQRMDLVGELMVEGFVRGCMYHVNGIAVNGRITHVWPFTYLHTCLGFSQGGSACGNASIPRSDPRYSHLLKATQRLLDILPQPSDCLVFHLELYENVNEDRLPGDDFILCEIGARAPGGSITNLIDLLAFDEDKNESFVRLAFRASVSLPIPTLTKEEDEEKVVSDLIVPRKPGKLMYIPRECPINGLKYLPIANVDQPTTYEKYDFYVLNTAARFIAHTKTMDEGQQLVEKGGEWFNEACIITPPDEPCTITLVKELHRYLHKKIFI